MATKRKPTRTDTDAAIAALDTVRRRWMRRPGVTAVDVGYKISNNELTDTLALRVHVGRKLAVAELSAAEVFNDTDNQKEVAGFPVDVIEATYGPSTRSTTAGAAPVVLHDVGAQAVDRRTRIRPLVAGISVGNPRITAGTLGALVFSRSDCRPMILTNFHVLAGDTAAAAGEPITQPGRLDGGVVPGDRVATLSRFRIDAQMDAAVATIDDGVTYDREILGLGTIAGTVAPTLGMQVVKSGRTTAITEGIIDGVSLTVSIDYGGSVGVVTLSDQIHIVPRPPWPAVDYEVSMGGDSGSVWLEAGTRLALGLHFAGETTPAPASENAIATPIDRVASEFDFSFLPVLCPPSRPPVRLDICRRYPNLCGLLRWPVFAHLALPQPPGVPPGSIPDPSPLVRVPQSGTGCSCGGAGGAQAGDQMLAVLGAELSALLEEFGQR